LEREKVRLAFNDFLKMYFAACKEVYKEIDFDQIKGKKFKYLKAIHKSNEITTTGLAEKLNLSKPTVTEVINHLLSIGLVEKRRSEEDKRVSYITLTAIGKTLATSNELESSRAVDKIYETLSPKEIKLLTKIFKKFGDEA
jgi:DNA-binding MarR family transcriptional regulator